MPIKLSHAIQRPLRVYDSAWIHSINIDAHNPKEAVKATIVAVPYAPQFGELKLDYAVKYEIKDLFKEAEKDMNLAKIMNDLMTYIIERMKKEKLL